MSKAIGAMVLALVLVPAWAFADVERRGTVIKVDKVANQLVVKTDRGEETFILDKSTKGIDNAKEGAKVIVKFTEKDGEPKVIEIVVQDDGTSDNAPR
jgi:hypothetical protein